jgi:hypothetical protein
MEHSWEIFTVKDWKLVIFVSEPMSLLIFKDDNASNQIKK